MSVFLLWFGALFCLLLSILKIEYFGQPVLLGDIKYLYGFPLSRVLEMLYMKEAVLLIGGVLFALLSGMYISRIRCNTLTWRRRVYGFLFSIVGLLYFPYMIHMVGPRKYGWSLISEFKKSQIPLYLYHYQDRVQHIRKLFEASDEDIQKMQARLCPLNDSSEAIEEPLDVVVYMVESLIDTSIIPIRIESLPLSSLRSLSLSSHRYSLFSPSVGGGSANSIFELLTGLSTMYRCTNFIPFFDLSLSPLWSIPRHLSQSSGYKTAVIHSGKFNMYNKRNAYAGLGFQKVVSLLDDTECESTVDGLHFCNEEFLVDAITAEIEQPGRHFVFAFSDSLHFPYRHFPDDMQYEFTGEKGDLSASDLRKLTAYLYRLRHADAGLARLKSFIDNRKKHTILIVIGDHPPPLVKTFSRVGVDLEKIGVPMLVYSNKEIPSFAPDEWSMNYFPLFLSTVMKQSFSKRDALYQSLIDEIPIMTRRHFKIAGASGERLDVSHVDSFPEGFRTYASLHYRSEKEICSNEGSSD